MIVNFPYRDGGIKLNIPEEVDVFHPAVRTPIAQTYHAIIKNLLRPLGYKKTLFDMAKTCKSACVVIDAFCPPPVTRQMVEPIIKTLHAAGMSHDDITILVSSEYPSEFSEERINSIFDPVFLTLYDVQMHKMFSYTKHELVGTTSSGTPVFLDKRVKDADIKIIAGNSYPHYLFGYSGAPLLLMLGLVGPETVQNLYQLADIKDLSDFWLLDPHSKFYAEMHEIFKITGLDFIVNVTVDSEQRIIDIFSGRPESVISTFMETLDSDEFSRVPEKADIVVSGTGGSHLETSWYHNIMGLCFAHSFLQPNGTVIFVTPLFEQFSPDHLNNVKEKVDLIKLFSLEKIITGTREKIFSCIEKSKIIIVSPNHEYKTLKLGHRSIFFCSSIDSALAFAREHTEGTPRTLLLPDGLLTFVRL